MYWIGNSDEGQEFPVEYVYGTFAGDLIDGYKQSISDFNSSYAKLVGFLNLETVTTVALLIMSTPLASFVSALLALGLTEPIVNTATDSWGNWIQ